MAAPSGLGVNGAATGPATTLDRPRVKMPTGPLLTLGGEGPEPAPVEKPVARPRRNKPAPPVATRPVAPPPSDKIPPQVTEKPPAPSSPAPPPPGGGEEGSWQNTPVRR